jgi:hypothetical protein
MAKDEFKIPLPPPPLVTVGLLLAPIDTTIKPTCSTITGDTIYVEGITTGDISITTAENIAPTEVLPPPLPIEQPDTSQTIFTGKIAYDSSRFVNPKAIDSVKTKNDSPNCDNDFIKL